MNKNKASEKCKSYHHGNLHDALIIAAAELIDENGPLDFAMIDAARRAGVSSAAPYRHFKDKDALLEAVREVAFMALNESIETTVAEFSPGSAEFIIALGKGYIRFVTSHPNYYDLMWGKLSARAMEKEQSDMKETGFDLLANAVQAWCDASGLEGNDPVDLATKLWAMAHGISALTMNNHIGIFLPDADIYALIESSTYTFLGGLEKKGG